jgi:hypothetical protein
VKCPAVIGATTDGRRVVRCEADLPCTRHRGARGEIEDLRQENERLRKGLEKIREKSDLEHRYWQPRRHSGIATKAPSPKEATASA